MRLAIRPTEGLQKIVIVAATIASVALLALVIGYWALLWLAPAQEPRIQAQADTGGQIAMALNLFGTAPQAGPTATPTSMAIRLLGVVAATKGRDGYAIVILDGRQILAAREGDEIAPGIGLAEVMPDHIVLERNGSRETLAWPEKPSSPESNTQRVPTVNR